MSGPVGVVAEPRGGARLLLAVYLLFIIYGSFFPLHFTTDPAAIRANVARAVGSFRDAEGRRNVSLPDLGSNVILGMPLGFLLVVGGLVRTSSALRRVAAGGVVGFLVASGVEAGQLFVPGRTPSIFDIVGQAGGSLTGALVAQGVLETSRGLPSRLRGVLRARPLLGPLAAILVVLAGDALFPYSVTLDVSTVWGNVKSSAWWPLDGLRAHPWHALVVDRLLPYVAVVVVAQAAVSRQPSGAARAGVAGLVVAFAGGLELAKLFIEGRSLQASNALLAAAGALLGIAAAPLIKPLGRTAKRWSLVVAGVALVAYHQLRPFDFTGSASAIRDKATRIEWVPFASYIMADPQVALLAAAKKLVLGGLLGMILYAPARHAGVWWMLLLSALLEIAQLAEVSHRTSLTDVVLLTLGAWLGELLLTRYQAVLDSRGVDTVPSPASALRDD
jgi:VanZ family protein